MSREHEERQSLIRQRFKNDLSQGVYEKVHTDYHAVADIVLVALGKAMLEETYDVAGSTSLDVMVRGPVHGHKIHVRVDMEEVLT